MNDDELRFRRRIEDFGFAMIYHILTLDKTLSDSAFRVYGLIIKYAQDRGRAWPGITRMAEDLGKSERSISRSLQELEGRNIITRQRRFGTSSITWIEDLNLVYQEHLEQLCESAKNGSTEDIESAKNGSTVLPKMAGKEELEKNNKGDEEKEKDYWSIIKSEMLLSHHSFETIHRINQLVFLEYQDSTVILSAPDEYTKLWVMDHLANDIQRLFIGIIGSPVKLQIVIPDIDKIL